MHRAEQIIDRVVAILTAASIQGVEKHRTLSFDQSEVPAISVRMGADQPPGESNIPIIDSELVVKIAAIVRESTEVDAISALMVLRSASHVALMADRQLGLPSIVSDCRYAGALEPEIDTSGEGVAALQETSWIVPYRMNLASPE